jgi:hypothetical protein
LVANLVFFTYIFKFGNHLMINCKGIKM